MCGIAGFSLSPQANVNAKKLAKAMLLDIESRGQDATGFAYVDSTGALQVHKDDARATEFVKRRLCLDKAATSVIMHTRFATQGRPEVNANNHPIATGAIVGVHNGHVNNDDELFDEMTHVLGVNPRIAQVDSEAIFAALNHYECAPKGVLEAISGGAAIAWFNAKDEKKGTLHLARLNSSPLVLAETADGSLLFASTQSAVMAGANAALLVVEKIRHIAEGSYITVADGEFTAVESFKPYKAPWRSTHTPTYKTNDYRSSAKHDSRAYAWDSEEYDMFDHASGKTTTTAVSTAGENVDAKTAEYQRWWRDNLKVIEAEAAFDKALVEDHNTETALEKARASRFHRFLKAPRLNSFLITDPHYVFTEPSEVEYLADPDNIEREFAIERWANGCKTDERTKTQTCLDMKAHVRPGYAVELDVQGKHVKGVIVSVPSTFPSGQYLIRAYVPRVRRPQGYEAVFVARNYWEFEVKERSHGNLDAAVDFTARHKEVKQNA